MRAPWKNPAYESALEEPSATTLHSLRIEFKRLRYTVSLFEGVLGTQIEGFIGDLKDLQDILGNLNDIATARGRLEGYQGEGVEAYLAWLDRKPTWRGWIAARPS